MRGEGEERRLRPGINTCHASAAVSLGSVTRKELIDACGDLPIYCFPSNCSSLAIM